MTARAAAWETLRERGGDGGYDVLVVGGGITGAAVLFEAARRGLRAALVERGDFASGTSSRSSKLVHGGLRYLREGRIGLTRESVREREELLRGAPGLVEPVGFVMPHYRGRKPGRTTLALGLALYDALAGSWQHRYVDRDEALELVPPLDPEGLQGAHCYRDATTDDAGLVLRLIFDACDAGATAVNYARATPLLEGEQVCGARVADLVSGDECTVRARAVVAATGAFADELRAALGAPPRLRPLRGSHLVVDDARLPLAQAVAFEHPGDGRPVFAYPWLGRTLVGTTDVDHDGSLDDEPAISRAEFDYLLRALAYQFPACAIGARDVVATYAGVRPIADAGAVDPSRASRDHAVWNDRGLITITGGKLTTFRPMAMDALAAAAPHLPPFDRELLPAFSIGGRFGARASLVAQRAAAGERERALGTPHAWAELRWCARNEAVVHLDDLLLRRTRIGLLTRDGGAAGFERIGAICRDELGWDQSRWQEEAGAYRARVAHAYGVPA